MALYLLPFALPAAVRKEAGLIARLTAPPLLWSIAVAILLACVAYRQPSPANSTAADARTVLSVATNGVSTTLAKDETPGDDLPGPDPPGGIDNDADTEADEDPTLNGVDEDGDGVDGEDPAVDVVASGEEQHVPVKVTVTNVGVPDGVTIQLGIAGPAVCQPRWIAGSTDNVSTATLGGLQISTLTRSESGMAGGESRALVRKYAVTCPPGAHGFNVYSNVSSASRAADPDMDNNQAENQLQVISSSDADGDGVPNPGDNCDWARDPDQADTDADGAGDVCDTDDDGDSLDVMDGGVPIFGDEREAHVLGTNPVSACAATATANDEGGADAWPPDFDDTQSVTITDILFFKPVVNSPSAYASRFDFTADGVVNISDVMIMYVYRDTRCAP